MEGKIFFSADTHYGHTNILKYCNRPYATVQEMNEDLIRRHNSVVGPLDTFFHLGDFSFTSPQLANRILRSLNGKKKILVKGNHDKNLKIMKEVVGFDEVYEKFVWNDWMLQHHPIKTNKKLLCGHVHDKWRRIGWAINVGVDQWNYTPVTIDQLVQAPQDLATYKCRFCNDELHRLEKNDNHWEGLCIQ